MTACSLILLAVLQTGSLWEIHLEGTPREGPLLVPSEPSGMAVLIPLGDHGLGGWDASGAPLPGYPVSPGSGVTMRPAFFSHYDGRDLIAYASSDGAVHAIGLDGIEATGWPFQTGSSVITGISAVDLDNDDIPELAFGTSDYRIHLLDPDGRELDGWPLEMDALLLWQPSELPLGGGSERGLVCAMNNSRIHLFRRSGEGLPGWPVNPGFPVGSIPISIDIDSDGLANVVFATQNRKISVIDIHGAPAPGWPFQLDARPVPGGAAGGHLEPRGINLVYAVSTIDSLVYLLNGDGSLAGTWRWPNYAGGVPSPPIMVNTDYGPAVVAGSDAGLIYAWNEDGFPVPGFPIEHGEPVSFAPAAGDLDGDGSIELVVIGRSGLLAAYRVSSYSETAGTWPQTLADEGNSGTYRCSTLPVATIGQMTGEYTGTVEIPYAICGGEYTGISVAFSTNAGFEWIDTGNYRDLGTRIEWSTEEDLNSADEVQCMVKITPYCELGSGESGMSAIFHVDNNIPPTLYLSPPVDLGDGRYELPYAVDDPEGDIIQLQAQFSFDEGQSWNLAHLSGSTLEIEPWFYGEPVIWNAQRDLGLVDIHDIFLRIRAADIDPGPWEIVENLQIDTDRLPSAQIITPTDEVSGRIRLGVRVSDPKTNPLATDYEYSTDGGSTWFSATVLEADVNVIAGFSYEIIWESQIDLPEIDEVRVRFRAAPPDSGGGIAVPSSPFHVDNNSLPSVVINSPGTYDVFKGLVPVRFSISDRETDDVRLGLEFRICGTTGWLTAHGLQNTGPFSQAAYNTVLRWNSAQDLPEARILDVDIRLLAMDGDTVYSDIVSPITLNNTGLPIVTQASLSGMDDNSGAALFSFELLDNDGRTIDLTVSFSIDNGLSWHAATVSGDLFSLSPLSYKGTFQWHYRTDLNGGSSSVFLRITPESGDLNGRPILLETTLR